MTEQYAGDLEKTQALADLFKTPKDARDGDWMKSFYANVADASFASVSPQVMTGPDGFPYFVLNIPESGKEFQCFVITHMLKDLIQMGVGVVIEPGEGRPQWVFSYGDLLGLLIKGDFEPFKNEFSAPPGFSSEVVENREQVLIGAPSEAFYPKAGREVLKRFIEAQGVSDPKLLLMDRKKGDNLQRELVFDLDDKKAGSHEKARALLGWISWFLPRGYGYCAVNHETFKERWQSL